MKLIPNAKKVLLDSYSQKVSRLHLGGIAAYVLLPEKMQDALPAWLVLGLAATLLALGIVVRVIEQPKLREGEAGEPQADQAAP